MEINLDDLANMLSYEDLCDYSCAALIMTGNGIQLSKLTEEELQTADRDEFDGESTLMEVALSHGDLDAIQTLVKSAIFKDDEATLKKYLKSAFYRV